MVVSFLNKEEELIYSATKNINDVSLINQNLSLVDENNIGAIIHNKLIDSLIYYYVNSKFKNYYDELKKIFNIEDDSIFSDLIIDDIELIPSLIEELHITFLNSEFLSNGNKIIRKKSKVYLKETGSVYTLKKITNEIVSNTIHNAVNG